MTDPADSTQPQPLTPEGMTAWLQSPECAAIHAAMWDAETCGHDAHTYQVECRDLYFASRAARTADPGGRLTNAELRQQAPVRPVADPEAQLAGYWERRAKEAEEQVRIRDEQMARTADPGGLRALRDEVENARSTLPRAVLAPGDLLHTDEATGALLTEVQRGSLRGQGAAFSWVLGRIDLLLAANDIEERRRQLAAPAPRAHVEGRHDTEDDPLDASWRTADPGGLREALAFIADWANDCADGDTFYGFADIEKRARAALASETTAPAPTCDCAPDWHTQDCERRWNAS